MKKKVFFIVMLTSKIFKTQHLHITWKIEACFSVVFITPYMMHHSVILWNSLIQWFLQCFDTFVEKQKKQCTYWKWKLALMVNLMWTCD